jgi:hypothetical protein
MIYLKHTLEWFQFPSLVIDLFSFIVLLLISAVSLKYYKLNKNKKSLYLSISFSFIAISFLFKLLTNAALFYDKFVTPSNAQIIIQTIRDYNIFSNLTFTIFAFFSLIGLYLLYKLYQGKQTYSNILLMSYFILISTYFSKSNYYIFHLTSLIFLISISSFYWKQYSKNNFINTKLLAYSFSIITTSQIFFIFTTFGKLFYLTGEIVQLGGYALLLLIITHIQKNGKKTV